MAADGIHIPQEESWSESLTAAATGAVQGQTGESGEPRRTEPLPSCAGGEQRPGGYVTRSDQGHRIPRLFRANGSVLIDPPTTAELLGECGCAYETADWNGQTVKRWFHDPECRDD